MTKQRNRPGVGVYFALILLLLCGYYLFFDMTRVPGVSYAQVEDLFHREQVQSFYVKDGSELYLSLRDGATVRNELGSTDRFREELGELIARWLRKLEREDRALFVRRYWNGDGVKELAGELGVRPNALTKRLLRLREALRRELEREGVAV